MITREFYLNNVYPQLDMLLQSQYPDVTLIPQIDRHPISEHPILMLVALTGTGKTTALIELERVLGQGVSSKMMPSRREIADWIALPTVQVLQDEPILPVIDRVKRFHYTRTFAKQVDGGMAAAFAWLNIANDYRNLILSEGIRGANEIQFALEECPGWYIVELALHPITRLQRLSSRDDQFDNASTTGDVTFLPEDIQTRAQTMLNTGDITPKALTIMQAEAENYGLYPFSGGDKHANYHCIDVDDLSPKDVAQQVITIMKVIQHAKD